jgi:hypothetical protein
MYSLCFKCEEQEEEIYEKGRSEKLLTQKKKIQAGARGRCSHPIR